jgi:hypothetical protein
MKCGKEATGKGKTCRVWRTFVVVRVRDAFCAQETALHCAAKHCILEIASNWTCDEASLRFISPFQPLLRLFLHLHVGLQNALLLEGFPVKIL